jgi:chloramphenicol-sensitive protein RarD
MAEHVSDEPVAGRSALAIEPVAVDGPVVGQLQPRVATSTAGLLFGLAAYGYWGLQPLYFKLVRQVPPADLVAHRTVWCAVLLVIVITALGRWSDFLRCLSSKRLVGLLMISSLLLASNWLLYIVSVATNRLVETSLGYFINPLFSVFLGVVFFRERPGPLQMTAILLAAIGIAYIVISFAAVPWLALGLAGCWGFYGLIRKKAGVDSLTGLTVETLLLTVPAGGYLLWQSSQGDDIFGGVSLAGRGLVMASGLVTAIPLLFFGAAARRLPLSTLGFLQFVAPSLQLVLAVWGYGEAFTVHHAISFAFIWAGLALFTAESFLGRRSAL